MMTLQFATAATAIFGAGGLSGLQNTLVQNFIGPLFIIAMAAFALRAFFKRAWAEFITLLTTGIVAALLIYVAPTFFGESGSVTKVAEREGKGVIDSGFGTSQLGMALQYGLMKLGIFI